MLENINF